MIIMQAEHWHEIVFKIFMAVGATRANAERVAQSLVDANMAGIDSHGVIRVPQYLQAIAAGKLDPASEPVVLKKTASSLLVDGKWTFGQVGARMCMQEAINLAKKNGMAVAALIRAYHIGRLGEYSEMAEKEGMISFVVSGGLGGGEKLISGGMAPHGGTRPVLGTNPISFGIPTGTQPPVFTDFATSTVALGKINEASVKGVQMPPGCIIDRDGKPTTDPEDYFNGGMILPFGGHKGYGLAVIAELLGEAFTGADTCGDDLGKGGPYMLAGNVFIVLDSGLFRPKKEFNAAADAIIRRIKEVPAGAGFSEVLLPGEPEQRSKARCRQVGIGLSDSSWEAIREVVAKSGLNIAEMDRIDELRLG